MSTRQLNRRIQFFGAEGQPYCTGLVNLLKQSDAVVYVHGHLAKRTPLPPNIQDIRISFVGGKDVASKTVHAGEDVVSTEMERLLTDGFNEVRSGLGTLSAEDEHRGRLLLLRGKDQEVPEKQTRGWDTIARGTERAMEKLCFSSNPAARE
ncbi:uncharacterized protein A1O9_01332 [Exophiala aquamarina CBS 119918]|uniref:Uncharacterized protein n=1 Tax=Exophiala aquamarina CBS 119918 TaxID=1182545 RepID=A0A072Q618_9EURO|nr:uncharacterized protein A1O9_01332 [Exophiala aquamarina CBS 119918]KEF63355.1 hypothetical protein A1O9_01332 [Exophiala aquamarina CBS 119918]